MVTVVTELLALEGMVPKISVALQNTPFGCSPVPLSGELVVRLVCFLFGFNVLDIVSFRAFNFWDVVIGVVEPSSGSGSERCRVGPDTVLGFVGGISS